jgi:hypothetical protein
MQVSLNWTELKPIEQLDFQENYGVYIWGFMFETEFVPYYVGIAFNLTISKRLTEHVNNLIGGRYCIIHSLDLKSFYHFKDIETESEESGLLYIPNWPDGYGNFLKRRHKLKQHIDNMVDRMHFTYAVITNDKLLKSDYELIEKYCINTIGKDKLWNTRAGLTNGFKPESITGDEKIIKLFKEDNAH